MPIFLFLIITGILSLNIYLPSWQLAPVYHSVQEQVNVLIPSKHVPECSHNPGVQSSMSENIYILYIVKYYKNNKHV